MEEKTMNDQNDHDANSQPPVMRLFAENRLLVYADRTSKDYASAVDYLSEFGIDIDTPRSSEEPLVNQFAELTGKQRLYYPITHANLTDEVIMDIVMKTYGSFDRIQIFPDFFTAGASNGNGGIVGGPGGLPVKPINSRQPLGIKSKSFPGVEASSTDCVQIAVLDSLPWHGNDAPKCRASPRSPSSIFSATMDSALTPQHPYDQFANTSIYHTCRAALTEFDIPGQPHPDLSDHGVFVVSVLRQIVGNEVTINLYEVLNQYAMGTLDTLIHGLLAALRHRDPNKPLLINLSLRMAVPTLCDFQLALRMGRIDTDFFDTHLDFIRFLDRDLGGRRRRTVFADLLTVLRDVLKTKNTTVVAAAGNDYDRLRSRYPAMFSEVIGVGALDRTGTDAPYSNRADDPTTAGFVTFGGTMDRQPGGRAYANANQGILGVYTAQNYPPDAAGAVDANTSGFASWAGTSFAAPIITGLIANSICSGMTRRQALEALQNAFRETSGTAHKVLVEQHTS